jgi:hypothetical protein
MTASKQKDALTSKSVDTSGDPLKPAEPDKLKAAGNDDLEASGALVEPTIKDRVDTKHPAVDDEPRKGLPETSNRIDFNDPTISGAEAVARNLGIEAKE